MRAAADIIESVSVLGQMKKAALAVFFLLIADVNSPFSLPLF
jgi:hypothetical protein